jgi:hypothetical protein
VDAAGAALFALLPSRLDGQSDLGFRAGGLRRPWCARVRREEDALTRVGTRHGLRSTSGSVGGRLWERGLPIVGKADPRGFAPRGDSALRIARHPERPGEGPWSSNTGRMTTRFAAPFGSRPLLSEDLVARLVTRFRLREAAIELPIMTSPSGHRPSSAGVRTRGVGVSLRSDEGSPTRATLAHHLWALE